MSGCLCFSLDGVLAGLANTSDGQAVILALKFMEVYLHSFNKALGDISCECLG